MVPAELRSGGLFRTHGAVSEPLIIANDSKRLKLRQTSEVYRQVESNDGSGGYELRPGVRLLLYVRRNRL